MRNSAAPSADQPRHAGTLTPAVALWLQAGNTGTAGQIAGTLGIHINTVHFALRQARKRGQAQVLRKVPHPEGKPGPRVELWGGAVAGKPVCEPPPPPPLPREPPLASPPSWRRALKARQPLECVWHGVVQS